MNNIISDNKYFNLIENVIETSYDGIYITDGCANTILVNSSYERITGLKKQEVIGYNMKELVSSGKISKSVTLLVLEHRKTKTLYQKFNTGKSALVTGTPFFDSNNEIQLVVTNVRDITDIESLEEKIIETNNRNLKYRELIEELKMQIAENEEIIADDENSLSLLLMAKRVAKVDSTIMLYGETGTGKDVLAKYIYNNSLRSSKPFIKINCGAIPETLIESEFFGYSYGAFTGALKGGKAGIFETADKGTLFLDEIGELPLNMQVKLLRVLQDGEITRIGEHNSIKVDVRIIGATNRNLYEMVEKKFFREDLFYRLNVIPLSVSPLRERLGSIMPLAEYFLKSFNLRYGANKIFSRRLKKYLYEYNWPGNIRELQNLIERLTITSSEDVIDIMDLPEHIIRYVDFHIKDNMYDKKLYDALECLEKEMILKAYDKYHNVRDAARELGIDPSTFVRKRKKYI
ncbi:sigma-54 interaction domain-containing protein [Alloiococcus sp. CFN-8]|uniref:sigma-54 interaction domain-containing protein n=1 Tax=Alloiococcus sp. CFN-8 TaxID=3416081 RepID=UPI003CEB0C95